MPHFRKGYDERLDLTEDEWLEQQMSDYDDAAACLGHDTLSGPIGSTVFCDGTCEGEPNEDTYFLGIPDYDCFNRPSWEVEE